MARSTAASEVIERLRGKLSSSVPLDPKSLQALKEKALVKAKEVQNQASESAASNLIHAKRIAEDIAGSSDATEAGRKVWFHWKRWDTGPAAKAFARALVCFFFINLVYENLEMYSHLTQQASMPGRSGFFSSAPKFPWLGVLLILPCSLLAAIGVRVPITGGILVIDMLRESSSMIWTQARLFIVYGRRPNELVVKRLGMVGCTAMVLVHSIKDNKKLSSYAGPLLHGDDSLPGHRKSLGLFLGRMLMTLLFLYVGYVQIKRIIARDLSLWQSSGQPSWGIKDGHDNNWLLLEFLLSIPFAVGYKTEVVSRLLSLTLALEAWTCWPFWSSLWPSWHYRSHVRLHFVTNLAVSGGLLMLQSFGAGRYTIDNLLKKKQ